MKRFSINLYFGFTRIWCFFYGTNEAAEQFANLWAKQYSKPPDEIYILLTT